MSEKHLPLFERPETITLAAQKEDSPVQQMHHIFPLYSKVDDVYNWLNFFVVADLQQLRSHCARTLQSPTDPHSPLMKSLAADVRSPKGPRGFLRELNATVWRFRRRLRRSRNEADQLLLEETHHWFSAILASTWKMHPQVRYWQSVCIHVSIHPW